MDKLPKREYVTPKLTAWSTDRSFGGLIGKGYRVPKLADLIDIQTLQQVQDWAARTAGVSILIRDAEGTPVTFPSMGTEFCDLISGEGHTNAECRDSNIRAAAVAIATGRPQKYTCHAGLTQFAAPIQVEGQFLGTIVIGDRPTKPLVPEHVDKLADKFGIDRGKLMKASQEVEIWSEETMNSTINFLYSLANTLFRLCYQGYALRRKVSELTTFLKISELLTSALSLQEVLDRIAEGMVKTLDFKSCTIRLLDDAGEELVLHSLYNLSPEYLSKGPVILEYHPVCQAAIRGETVIIQDVSTDSRFGYPEAAKKEGLCSMLCVGLMSREAIGTVHLYTGEPHDFTEDEIELTQSIANHAAAAIERVRLYGESAEKQRIEQELVLAGEIQAALLPAESPDLIGFDIKAKLVPCRQLSGDLYDFIDLGEGRMGLVIADVSGKGAPGAILMAATRVIVRTQAESMAAAGEIVSKVNDSLCEDTRPTEFVSMFYSLLDAKSATLTYSNAGHNPPVIFRGDQIIFLEEGGIPLGIVPGSLYDEGKAQLASGDVLLFYTDGVTEAMNQEKDIFGVGQLINVVQQNLAMDAQSLIDVIYDEVIKFSAGEPQSDDLTLIVLKVD
jgi:serine phosphatase RsbU (regulator of sigma subunit)/ligand-binding sensor protein